MNSLALLFFDFFFLLIYSPLLLGTIHLIQTVAAAQTALGFFVTKGLPRYSPQRSAFRR